MPTWLVVATATGGYLAVGGVATLALLPWYWREAIRRYRGSYEHQAEDVAFYAWLTVLLWPFMLVVGGSVLGMRRMVALRDPRKPGRAERAEQRRRQRAAEQAQRTAELERELGL